MPATRDLEGECAPVPDDGAIGGKVRRLELDQLREEFNHSHGCVRLVTLLSPT